MYIVHSLFCSMNVHYELMIIIALCSKQRVFLVSINYLCYWLSIFEILKTPIKRAISNFGFRVVVSAVGL